MSEILVSIISFALIFLGIFSGFILSKLIHEYIAISMPSNEKKSKDQAMLYFGIDDISNERYKLGVAKPHEHFEFFDHLEIKDRLTIVSFFTRMNELGIQYVYLKPKDSSRLLYVATYTNNEKVLKAEIHVKELD